MRSTAKVEIVFEAPTKEWVGKRNAPTIDMYLYDIREDTTRRETAWIDIRDENSIVKERRLPPRRFRLSYLVTAWTNRPEDEHRLLSAMLGCFVRHEYMPPELLTGRARGLRPADDHHVALPVPADRNIADVWSAMGGELKPSLDLIVTAPLDIERSLAAGPPVQETPFLELVKAEPGTIGKGKNGKGPSHALPTADADITATGGLAGSELTPDETAAAATTGGKQGKGVARSPSGTKGEGGLGEHGRRDLLWVGAGQARPAHPGAPDPAPPAMSEPAAGPAEAATATAAEPAAGTSLVARGAGERDPSLNYFLARLALFEGRVRIAVQRRRAADADPGDRFRGLYISEAKVDELLAASSPDGSALADVDALVAPEAAAIEAHADEIEAAGVDLRLRRLVRAFGLDATDVELLLRRHSARSRRPLRTSLRLPA